MPSNCSRGEPLTPYDSEFGGYLCSMNNQEFWIAPTGGRLGSGEGLQAPWEVNENNQGLPDNRVKEALRPLNHQGERLNDIGMVKY